jgi:HSP20 family protein
MMTTTWGAFPVLDRVFDEAVRSSVRGGDRSAFPIAADLREKSDDYTFQLDVPGVKVEDLEITLTNRVLTIRGERRFEAGHDEKVTRGRPYGQFVVSYALPDSIEGDGLTADLAEGVLSVRVPKQPKAQPRKIPIGSVRGEST